MLIASWNNMMKPNEFYDITSNNPCSALVIVKRWNYTHCSAQHWGFVVDSHLRGPYPKYKMSVSKLECTIVRSECIVQGIKIRWHNRIILIKIYFCKTENKSMSLFKVILFHFSSPSFKTEPVMLNWNTDSTSKPKVLDIKSLSNVSSLYHPIILL